MTRKVQLVQIQNVGPNQRATIRLPLGVTYNKIVLFCAGNITAALLSNIVLKINGGERQRWKTQAHMQARNTYNGNASDAAVLEFDFMERQAKDEAAMTLGTYACTQEAGVQDATIEFDLGAYTVTAASKITAIAEVDVPSANRLIVRNRYMQKTLAGAVEEQIIIPYGLNGEQLKRLYIFGTLANIESVRIRREGADEYEALTQVQNEFFQKTYGKVPQAGLFVVDFTEHNLMGHLLNTANIVGAGGKPVPVQNLDIRLRTTAAGTFDIYTEAITLNDRP
ncbi:major capsid protein P2 [uncultured Pseudacidovorax sp.]|uniref:major capsid protein P2 n=1 Tax=uncultured Pseudacidovorax sp. TaxID=679313 RepID=UPI0025ED6349|nr:major capsid protein P2 [uncultured Pseudacidovorax sp.]